MKIEFSAGDYKKYRWIIPLTISYFPIRYVWDSSESFGRTLMACAGASAAILITIAWKEPSP